MVGFRLSGYINDLHQQIYQSVDKIKRRKLPVENETNSDILKKSHLNRYGVEEYRYQLLSGDVRWSLQNMAYSMEKTITYGVSSYNHAGNIGEKPKILLDLMYKNNREFDFKV